MAEPPAGFASVLRQMRTAAGLTQEELGEASGVSPRQVSDLERGVVTTPHKETVRLLAGALKLDGSARADFELAARGHVAAGRGGSTGVAAATRTLPRDIASFTGRRDELAALAELSDAAAGAGGIVSIHAIGGMAGIGKTAFAVHAAHQLAGRFPGGQVFLPLHGHTPGRQPVDPADALASLLLVIGIPAGQVPPDMAARTALWRDRLAGRRLLLLLDDAASSEQVRPLLPGTGGSLVLVTSRRRLTALEDAHTISLDALPPGEAAGLLVRLAVRPGLSSADPAVREVARLCGCLPLAIGMLARRLYHHPSWTVAGLAADLADAVDRLELLATENVSAAAAFDLSYADLSPGQRQLFRRLALHPGTDVDRYAAAALDGTSLTAARAGLEALYEHYLLAEPAPGRYRMHDLVREHARGLADRLDTAADREQATARLLDYYQHAAARANALITRYPHGTTTTAAAPVAVPVLAGQEQGLAWARAERASLLACLDQATADGDHARVITLTAGLEGLLQYDGPWDQAVTRHAAAVHAARQLSDRPGQADALNDLANVRRLTGDYQGAERDLEEALGIYQDLDDRAGQANALSILGTTLTSAGDYPGAIRDLERALGICRHLGSRLGQANALYYLGVVRYMVLDLPGATRDLQEQLSISRDIGDRMGQVTALTHLGRVRQLTGDLPGATRDLQEALDISREVSRFTYALALTYLAAVRRLTGDYADAARDLQEALGIYRDLGTRQAEAAALNEYGTLSKTRRDLGQARASHQQALDLARQTGAPLDEAHALAGLGRTALADGDTATAEDLLRQALAIYQRIGAAETAGLDPPN